MRKWQRELFRTVSSHQSFGEKVSEGERGKLGSLEDEKMRRKKLF